MALETIQDYRREIKLLEKERDSYQRTINLRVAELEYLLRFNTEEPPIDKETIKGNLDMFTAKE